MSNKRKFCPLSGPNYSTFNRSSLLIRFFVRLVPDVAEVELATVLKSFSSLDAEATVNLCGLSETDGGMEGGVGRFNQRLRFQAVMYMLTEDVGVN